MTEKTLRDEIAIAAMQGMLSYAGAFEGGECSLRESAKLLVARSYIIADEMLKQRGETE